MQILSEKVSNWIERLAASPRQHCWHQNKCSRFASVERFNIWMQLCQHIIICKKL